LQFNDVGNNRAFLPLAYQVQATETQIIDLEEQIKANKDKHDYYTSLLSLDEFLYTHVDELMPTYHTLDQFHVFLTANLAEYKEDQRQLKDHLDAYIKRIENKIASVMPLVEKPKVYPVAKGTVQKSTVVFVAALMISIFASFLLDAMKNARSQVLTALSEQRVNNQPAVFKQRYISVK
jgi:hypothetical protein